MLKIVVDDHITLSARVALAVNYDPGPNAISARKKSHEEITKDKFIVSTFQTLM
jgi:hypothetical protein